MNLIQLINRIFLCSRNCGREGWHASAEDGDEDDGGETDADMEVRNYFHNQENDYEDMTGHSRRSPTPDIIHCLEDIESDYFKRVVPVIEEAFERYMYDAFQLKEQMLVRIYQRLRHNINRAQTRSLDVSTTSRAIVRGQRLPRLPPLL